MKNTHIFLDNSNIFGGAQRAAADRENAPWQSVRVQYANLLRLLVHGKANRRTSMLAGSVPPGNEALWDAARSAGFDTTLLRRVSTDTGRLVEQGVDEAIHLRIGNTLLDEDNPGILVLATGDGRVTEQGCSFTQQVIRAAKREWQIEIWSWHGQLSKFLRNTRVQFPDKITIYKFDAWYRSIVFIKSGEYEINGNKVSMPGRNIDGLDLTETTFKEGKLT